MLQVPVYLSVLFVLTTIATVFLGSRVVHSTSRSGAGSKFLIGSGIWLAVQGFLAYQLVYMTSLDSLPPRLFLFGLAPFIIFSLILFLSRVGKRLIDEMSFSSLVWVSIVRIPVELCLYGLAVFKTIPYLMSFEGANFDILAGILAIPVALFALNPVRKSWLWTWNIVGALLLMTIIVLAVLSAPFPLQQLAFDTPNIGVLHFPFVWLPVYVAPLVLLTHFIMIRKLIYGKY